MRKIAMIQHGTKQLVDAAHRPDPIPEQLSGMRRRDVAARVIRTAPAVALPDRPAGSADAARTRPRQEASGCAAPPRAAADTEVAR